MEDSRARLRLPAGVPARTANFGAPIAEFRASTARVVFLKVISVGAIVLGIGIFVLLLCLALLEEPSPEPTWRDAKAILRIGAFGIMLIGAGFVGRRSVRQTRGMRVFVCPEGIARIQGEKGEALRWDEIVTVQRVVKSSLDVGPKMTGMLQLNLTDAEGRTFAFNENLTGLREFRLLVEKHTLDRLLAGAMQSLQADGAVEFGKLRATREGLVLEAAVLPWDKYETAEVSHGELTIKEKDTSRPFCKLPLEQIPNVHVLIGLIEKLHTG
jgi:hypothetical protein